MPTDDKEMKSLIEKLYEISIKDIAQLKNRQWDVTKWVLAANLALFIPIAIREKELPTGALCAIATLSLFLGILGGATILKTQSSLKGTRVRQKAYRERHSATFVAVNECGGTKPGHECFCYDGWVWVPMLAVALISSLATIFAVWHLAS